MKWTGIVLLALSPIAQAASQCQVESFQPIDIEPTVKAVQFDRDSEQAMIVSKPPMRCANVTFTTAVTRGRQVDWLRERFEATYFDGSTRRSHEVNFKQDDLSVSKIRVGPNLPATAYVCFTTSETPISSISCDID
ncbi:MULTISPECIES: hypothetical protein [Vibrio]|uniref:Ig-like domain-containing protein n=1 Tax=Vibrio proteolyticus NBRC 13287 TaxID=1219065 RepID=U2ZWT9_VIBPR|nr:MULTISPECIES: hypothetical protein [Vibrio]NAW57838.1 hypothetical protein [Vibrio sp. V36_P2S2PM302]NAX20446.1 hypothetical protein [Vibrio sp. V39_P1S14PM300]NAX28378.1 hypothetical protein [Vibrio sp. V38_P2S17PM301]NAX30128.1 hypothetical protein [Vibrio sp. V37_P2S8PM304]GAD65577.1 hypothetical protein VPR01S_01_03500 [Vibrio proteolyticus NBRC 13287]